MCLCVSSEFRPKAKSQPLTAGDSKRAFLTVQGVELEIHRAGQCEGDSAKLQLDSVTKFPDSKPDTVKYKAVGEDSNINIRHQNVVKSSLLFVSEESVRHPNFPGISHRQILDTT